MRAGIDEVRFKRIVVPGDTLRLEITMEKLAAVGKGRGVASVDGEVACEGLLSFIILPAGVLMTRIAVLSDIHGNLSGARGDHGRDPRRAPDHVLVAGDLVLNGPDPAAVIDALRAMESDGAAIVGGNTDIAVADFDYGAAFPQYQDGVPETVSLAAEWAHDQLSDEQLAWLRRLPSERRMRAGDDLVLVVHAPPGRRPAASTRRSMRTESSAPPPSTRGSGLRRHTHVPEVRGSRLEGLRSTPDRLATSSTATRRPHGRR